MTPLNAQPSPELGLDLVRDVVDVRRLPRWDPRYWGHVGLEDEPRCSAQFRLLGLSWAKARLTPEPLPHERDGERELAKHELGLKPEHAIAGTPQRAVPPPISAAPAGVIAAIDLEVGRGRTEINDESAKDDLPFEADAQLTAANGLPEALFGGREGRAQGVSAGREQLSASEIERAFFQGSLLVPAKWPGVARLGAGSVTRAHRIAHALTARGAERAPLGAARPLRRDEVRGKQPSIPSPSFSLVSRPRTHQLEKPLQARPPLDGAAPQRDYLPHSRAAHAACSVRDEITSAPRSGAREHEFGEGRAPAGGVADEDARVGAGITGKEEDSEFGLVYFGKRFYSPQLNRWVTADPAGCAGY